MNKLIAALILIFLESACTTTAPVIQPVTPLGITPASVLAGTATPVPSIRSTGPSLAYLNKEGNQNVVVFMDENGNRQKLVSYPADTNAQANQPALSNTLSVDGQWLAYYKGSAGQCFSNGQTNSTNLTLNLLSLADGKSQIITSLLSPDYPNNFVKATEQLQLHDITADELQNAFICGITQSIAWSPDGKLLAFAGQMDGLSSDLYIYNPTDQSIKRLSSGPEEIQKIAWSPDGQWILNWSSYWVGEGMSYSVYATSRNGEVVKKLFTNNCDNVDWLFGTTYSFSNCANGIGEYNLSLINVETGEVTRIWDGQFSSLAVSTNHQWLVYSSHSSSQSLKTGSDPNFIPGIYLVNLTNLKVNRVELTDNFENYQSLQAVGNGDQTFGLLNTSDHNLDFLSEEGKLSSVGINAIRISLSPDSKYIAAIGQSIIHLLQSDGSSIRDLYLPSTMTSDGIETIIWRSDSSGFFFTYQVHKNYDAPIQLYLMDLLTDNPKQIDTISFNNPSALADFIWVASLK